MREEDINADEIDIRDMLDDLFPGADLSPEMPLFEFIRIVVEKRQSEELLRRLKEFEAALHEEPLEAPPEYLEIYARIADPPSPGAKACKP